MTKENIHLLLVEVEKLVGEALDKGQSVSYYLSLGNIEEPGSDGWMYNRPDGSATLTLTIDTLQERQQSD